MSAPPSGSAAHAQSAGEAKPAEWYFVGGTSVAGEASAETESSGYAGGRALSMPGAERYEFVLSLSDTADPDRLGFSSGQSLAFSVPRDTYTFLVNRTMVLDLGTAVTPHFMAGLGLTYQSPENPTSSSALLRQNWQPALQFGVGASYDVTDSLAISARLRAFYLGSETLTEPGATDGQFSQDFFVGARLRF